MSYEKQMLEAYKYAFQRMSEGLSQCVDLDDGAMLCANIYKELDSLEQNIKEEEDLQKLKGRGPTARLRYKLGLSKSPTAGSLFKRLGKKEELTDTRAREIIYEFFSPNTLGSKRGGVVEIDPENLKPLPKDGLENLSEGIYSLSNEDHWSPNKKIVVCIQTYRPAYGFIFFTINRKEGSIDIRKATFVESEKEWIFHSHLELASYKSVRSALVNLLRPKLGAYLNPVTEKKLLSLFSKKRPDKEEGERSFVFNYQDYRVCINWIYVGVLEPFYKLSLYRCNHSPLTGAQGWESIRWEELSTVKQNQLFEYVENKLLAV